MMSTSTFTALTAAAGLLLAAAPAAASPDSNAEWLSSAFKPAAAERATRGGRKSQASAPVTSWGGSSGGSGIASYYWQPQAVASGGRFNPNALTAAHKTLPFGTRVRVTNQTNGRSVEVVINDRGPFVKGRVIDLSRRAAQVIGMTGAGLASVSLDVL